ncbi:MAG: hypothetical protein LBG87_04645 [Spirochaetaceae bacterium]|jgi:hypothetical protein|nr:hypothetical protein [Spirochaetaceae bacterium]
MEKMEKMGKILLCVFLLAPAMGASGQDAPEQGLKLGGSLRTGLRFAAGQELIEGAAENLDPAISVWHDDSGAVRLHLEGSYTKDNYGAAFRLRLRPVELAGDSSKIEEILHQGYVWANLLHDIVTIKAGKIDDAAWDTAGDEEFSYATGYGIRFEIHPIPGSNFGFFLNPTNNGYLWDKGIVFNSGLNQAATAFMLETAFGAKYEHDFFDAAAGLRLDGKGDGLDTEEWYGYQTSDAPHIANEEGDAGESYDKDHDKGLGFYLGVKVKAVENLTLAVEARFNNMTGFNDYGWIWIDEVIEYKLSSFAFGLIMYQYLFGSDNRFVPRYDDAGVRKDDAVAPYLTFKPYIAYNLTEKWTLKLEVPVKLWPGIVDFDLGVKPKVSYKLGDNAALSGYYLFNVLQYNEATEFSTNFKDKPDLLTAHAIQINFEWSF